MPASIPGIHHVTCITGDVQKNVDFYVSVLGLRFVKKSINQDLPDTYHLYFGDHVGSPGTAMTFFGWPTWPRRNAGSGHKLGAPALFAAVPEASAGPDPTLGAAVSRPLMAGAEIAETKLVVGQRDVRPVFSWHVAHLAIS